MTPEELRELAGRYKDFGENQFAKFLNAAADEIERLKMELHVLECFRDDDRKALEAFAEYDGDEDLWASLKRQRDEAVERIAELERVLRLCVNAPWKREIREQIDAALEGK